MPAQATARYVRVSPYKVRRVLALIRGRDVSQAVGLLRFTPGEAAALVKKVLESAAANAQNNHGMDRERLWVQRAYADGGPSLRRYRPGSMGRGGIIRRRMSHITVVLEERPAQPAVRRGRRAARAATAPGARQEAR